MKHIQIADTTLCREGKAFSFKEKLEIARQLEKLNTDVIELPEIQNSKTDILFVRTASSFVKQSVLSVAAGKTAQSVSDAIAALSNTARPRIRIELPTSPVGMEYICHKKPPKMLEWIDRVVKMAKEGCADVEFSATDATRAEREFLKDALITAVNAGATSVSVCDSAAEMLPDDFAAFVEEILSYISVPVGVRCANLNGLSAAAAILSVRRGAQIVKTNVDGGDTPLETFSSMVRNCGNNYGFTFGLRYTELNRIIGQIHRITDVAKNEKSSLSLASGSEYSIHLDKNDSREDIMSAATALGYDLSEEDQKSVYDEFLRVAEKKNIGAKELDAIIASAALQVPSTYTLESYVINSSNIITSSAQITLTRDANPVQGICMGDGPIDAAFLALEQIIGHHYELDDFQIQSVTEGKEAMGSAIVKLRNDGKLYSGTGISTDIIGASIKAYLNAVNKILYEETQA